MKEILINSPKHGEFTILVDDADYERCKSINWIIFYQPTKRHTAYASRWVEKIKGKDRYEWLHHFILTKPQRGLVVDHIDGNGLNNQKSNLRICTPQENMANQRIRVNNTSGCRGVHFCRREEKWVCRIGSGMKRKFIGNFKTLEAAEIAWHAAAKDTYGDFYRSGA